MKVIGLLSKTKKIRVHLNFARLYSVTKLHKFMTKAKKQIVFISNSK